MITFKQYKNRKVVCGQTIQVYRNLIKSFNLNSKLPVYSIRDAKSCLVLGHSECLIIRNARFKVCPKGRQRVFANGRNIHAYIVGNYQSYVDLTIIGEKVIYDPYTCETFIDEWTREPVHEAVQVVINSSGVYYV